MTISDPISASLYEYSEDAANELYVYDSAEERQAHEKVVHNGVIYRAKERAVTHGTPNPRDLLVLDIDENFVKWVACETNYTRYFAKFNEYWNFVNAPTAAIRLLTWGYGFMLWDYAFPRSLNGTFHPDEYGEINFPPPNTTEYRKFSLSGGDVVITDYVNGTSMENPGTVDSTTTMSTTAFAAAYPGLIFFDDLTQFKSTLGGTWETDADTILETAFAIQFGGSLDIADDTRWEVMQSYEPDLVLDIKNYTGLWAKNSCKFILKADEKFDTVALGRVQADFVNVVFREPTGTVLYERQGYPIDNRRDVREVMSPYPATHVIYCAHENTDILTQVVDAGGTVEIEFHGDEIFIGTIQLGIAVDAGISDFKFTTTFQDFSPVEVIFNVIHYKEGLKVKDYKGSFDFWTKRFDMMDRLFVSLGGKQVIVNGSDTTDNCQVDSQDRFAATMILGRFKSLPLKTIKEDDRLGILARADFTIREIV